MAEVVVDDGVGCFTIDDWRDLWTCVWRAVSCAIFIKETGACRCGCTKRPCHYCIHECF